MDASLVSTSADGNGNQFESLKHTNEHGVEYWSARDLQPHLGYSEWRNFQAAVKKAAISCRESGNEPDHHFVGANKMVELGSGAKRKAADYHLSRFACYLIAQNGDPRKPEIAFAQKYFAVQTRKMEMSEQYAADVERLDLRKQTSSEFKALSGVARQAGVRSHMFGIFHDAGYKGLYGGRGRDAILRCKKIPEGDELLDRMGSTELAANNFRLTQTRDKIIRDRIKTEDAAIRTHQRVGAEVRKAIEEIGGTLPEYLPAEEHIKVVEKRVKSAKPKIELAESDAKGLLPEPNTPQSFDEL